MQLLHLYGFFMRTQVLHIRNYEIFLLWRESYIDAFSRLTDSGLYFVAVKRNDCVGLLQDRQRTTFRGHTNTPSTKIEG